MLLVDPARAPNRGMPIERQVTDEVDAASPLVVSAPASSSATPLGSSYADLAAAADVDADLSVDADAATAGERPTVQPGTQEVGISVHNEAKSRSENRLLQVRELCQERLRGVQASSFR